MTVAWRPNPTAPLWYEERRGEPVGPFFHDLSLQHTRQVGPSCVATTLSMVANATGAQTTPEDFKAVTHRRPTRGRRPSSPTACNWPTATTM